MDNIFAEVPSSRMGNRSVRKSLNTLPVTEMVSRPARALVQDAVQASAGVMNSMSSPVASWARAGLSQKMALQFWARARFTHSLIQSRMGASLVYDTTGLDIEFMTPADACTA